MSKKKSKEEGDNMRVGMKIGLGFLVVILVLAVMGGVSFYSAGNIADQVTGIQRASQRVEVASSVDQAFTEGVMAIGGICCTAKIILRNSSTIKWTKR